MLSPVASNDARTRIHDSMMLAMLPAMLVSVSNMVISASVADTATSFPRDQRGEWVPRDLPGPSPVFSRPWRVKQVLNSLFGLEGLLGWQAMIYTGLCVVAWLFFTPEMERMRTFRSR